MTKEYVENVCNALQLDHPLRNKMYALFTQTDRAIIVNSVESDLLQALKKLLGSGNTENISKLVLTLAEWQQNADVESRQLPLMLRLLVSITILSVEASSIDQHLLDELNKFVTDIYSSDAFILNLLLDLEGTGSSIYGYFSG